MPCFPRLSRRHQATAATYLYPRSVAAFSPSAGSSAVKPSAADDSTLTHCSKASRIRFRLSRRGTVGRLHCDKPPRCATLSSDNCRISGFATTSVALSVPTEGGRALPVRRGLHPGLFRLVESIWQPAGGRDAGCRRPVPSASRPKIPSPKPASRPRPCALR